jgi:hypothetical protein
VICKNFILNVINFRGRAIDFAICISHVVLHNFFEVERVSGSEKYVLDLLLVVLGFALLVLFAIVSCLVVKCVVFGVFLCAALPVCIFELLALGLFILVDRYLDARQGNVHCT